MASGAQGFQVTRAVSQFRMQTNWFHVMQFQATVFSAQFAVAVCSGLDFVTNAFAYNLVASAFRQSGCFSVAALANVS